MTSVDIAALPGISFAPASASEVQSQMIQAYERITRRSLQPGDPERLFLESLAYAFTVQNGLIDLAGKQNLLAHARRGHLDHLGAFMGVTRLAARRARCMVRFSLTEALGFDVPVPLGTRCGTPSGNPLFATMLPAVIPAGELFVDVPVEAVDAGADGNGLVPGQINAVVDVPPHVRGVQNISTTLSGADAEKDDRFRERIRLAPESFSNAGSDGAYEFHTLSVSQDILAVTVQTPSPGVVDVRFCMTGGELPDEATLVLVRDALNAETVRPLTDKVLVAPPEPVVYAIEGQWFLRRKDAALARTAEAAVNVAVENFRLWQRSQPGRDINPTRLIALVERAGAKRVALRSPFFLALDSTQIARESDIALTFGGVEDE